jgi:hypothetical protein
LLIFHGIATVPSGGNFSGQFSPSTLKFRVDAEGHGKLLFIGGHQCTFLEASIITGAPTRSQFTFDNKKHVYWQQTNGRIFGHLRQIVAE